MTSVPNTLYPLDSFLSSWWCNPTLEQPQPGLDHTYNAGYINSQTFSNGKLPSKTLTQSPTALIFNLPPKDACGWFEFRQYMFWVSFVLGSNFTFLCFLDKIMDNNELKQRNKIQFEPRIKLRHNIKSYKRLHIRVYIDNIATWLIIRCLYCTSSQFSSVTSGFRSFPSAFFLRDSIYSSSSLSSSAAFFAAKSALLSAMLCLRSR